MSGIFMIAEESRAISELRSGLTQNGFACSFTPDGNGVIEQVTEESPDLVLVGVDNCSRVWELSQMIKKAIPLPVMALVSQETLDSVDGHLDLDDFITKPCDIRELVLRVKRLLRRADTADSSDLIRCGDLAINLATCEVSVADRTVILTFREYELLRFLASNRGRVFTRGALLDKVWGYDYYGGDRTVDVHIRRLRSKLEDSTHTFIATVRNIGYRFVKDR